MDEPELRKELLNQVDGGTKRTSEKTREDARRMARRAGRRTRILAGVTLSLWFLVAIGIFYMVYGYFVFFHPVLMQAMAEGEAEDRLRHAMRFLPDITIYAAAIWGATIVLAAVATVLFILVSRQATLRQIQVSLEEIVEQLKAAAHQ